MISSAEAAAYVQWVHTHDPLLRRCISRKAFFFAEFLRICFPKWVANVSRSRRVLTNAMTRELVSLHPACVLDIGAGYSVRGLQWVQQHEGTYVEVDFPQILDRKKAIFPKKSHLHFVRGNVLTQMQNIKKIIQNKKTVVIIEGVLTYMEPAEVEELFTLLRLELPKETCVLTHKTKKSSRIRTLLWGKPSRVDVKQALQKTGWFVRESSGILIASET